MSDVDSMIAAFKLRLTGEIWDALDVDPLPTIEEMAEIVRDSIRSDPELDAALSAVVRADIEDYLGIHWIAISARYATEYQKRHRIIAPRHVQESKAQG